MKKITLLSYANLVYLIIVVLSTIASNRSYGQIPVSFGTNSHAVPEDLFGFNGENTIRPDQSWGDMLNNTNSQTRLQELNARVLRYPGGTLGNYWDWRRGWFLRNYDLQNSVLLPADYNEKPPATSGFDDKDRIFLDCIASSYAIPMWQWNVLSSDSKYQLATLYAAREKGIRKQYVELGNELYLAHTDNRNVYPNVDNYSEMAIDWASQIKNIPPFGNIKIAALGAENASIDEPGRRIFWLSNLLAKVGSNSDISAITLHQYERAKFSGAKDDISCVCDAALLPADFEFALSKGIIDAQEMVDDEVSQIANYGKEVWIHPV